MELEERHLEQAADWFLLLAEAPSPDNLRRWEEWHNADSAHRAAWQKVEKLQSLLAGAPRQTRQTLERAQHAQRRGRRQTLGVLGVALVCGLVYALLPRRDQAAQIEWIATARGERRQLTLPDGGSMWLASDTRIGIAYRAASRDIYLSQGALQLSSGHDAQGRPLQILSRDGVVRPLGTRLTVAVYASQTVLAVQQHAAEVRPLQGAAVRVEAGQSVRFTASGSAQPQPAPSGDDAWTRGVVMALNMPLAEFAAQFALYSGQPLEVAPALAARRVSGSFQLDAPERSLQTLAEVLAIRLDRSQPRWRLQPR
jgi:transmembrane sensor